MRNEASLIRARLFLLLENRVDHRVAELVRQDSLEKALKLYVVDEFIWLRLGSFLLAGCFVSAQMRIRSLADKHWLVLCSKARLPRCSVSRLAQYFLKSKTFCMIESGCKTNR